MKPSHVCLSLHGLLFGLAEMWQLILDNKMVGKSIKGPERHRIIVFNPRCYTGQPRAGTMHELARICDYFWANFDKVATPFLTIPGTDDGVTSPAGSQMLYDKTTVSELNPLHSQAFL